jgi:hypothetical protein
MKTLIQLYEGILQSVGLVPDSQGFISTIFPGGEVSKPFLVNSKRLVLPYPEQLQQPDWSNRVGFHPLLQSVPGGETPVMEKFRERMNTYADFILGNLLLNIAQLAQQDELHKDLTPEQAQYLGPFSEVDAKFVKLLWTITTTKRLLKKNCEFVRFSVIKGRVWEGQKRSRVATLHFPLYEQLPKEDKGTELPMGVKLRIADVKMLRRMYEYLFPGIREAGHYEIGSDSKVAPSIESLMALYAKFSDSINSTVSILEPVIKTSTALMIVNDWRDDLANAAKYLPEIRKIPSLEGNVPSERVATAGAPVRITETPTTAAVRVVVGQDTAPTITHDMIPQQQPAQQPMQQQVQPTQSETHHVQPRFKLGQRAPTIGQATHQLPAQFGHDLGSGIHHTPVAQPVAPTPRLGPMGQTQSQQQPAMQPTMMMQPQMQMQMQPQQPQALKVPETARLINGQLYIPVESNGVSALPPNAVMYEGKVYVPMAQIMGGMQPQGVPMAGNVLPGQQQGMMQGRMGMPMGQITDPSQVPGLSPEEIQMYRMNPVMFQNFLQQMQLTSNMAFNAQQVQRQGQVPRYLRTAMETAQQQNSFATRGFLSR